MPLVLKLEAVFEEVVHLKQVIKDSNGVINEKVKILEAQIEKQPEVIATHKKILGSD